VKKIVVLKNDAIGDTMHSLPCIKQIVNLNNDKEIFFFLSKRNKDIYNFIKKENTRELIFNYKLNLYEKLKILLFFIKNKIDEVYILAPRNIFFFLPFLFRNTKFFGVCVNNLDNKFRPSLYLRKYLHKKEINNRNGITNRKSIKRLQLNLVSYEKSHLDKLHIKINKNIFNSDLLKHIDKYILFHFKKSIFDKLEWNIERVIDFVNLLSNKHHVILTTDIEGNEYVDKFIDIFNVYDAPKEKFLYRNKKITYFHNFSGSGIFDLVGNSSLTIGVHGLFTNISSYLDVPTIDLFYVECKKPYGIKSYLDAAREFSPFNKKYFKVIPNGDYNKLKFKIKNFLNYAK